MQRGSFVTVYGEREEERKPLNSNSGKEEESALHILTGGGGGARGEIVSFREQSLLVSSFLPSFSCSDAFRSPQKDFMTAMAGRKESVNTVPPRCSL